MNKIRVLCSYKSLTLLLYLFLNLRLLNDINNNNNNNKIIIIIKLYRCQNLTFAVGFQPKLSTLLQK